MKKPITTDRRGRAIKRKLAQQMVIKVAVGDFWSCIDSDDEEIASASSCFVKAVEKGKRPTCMLCKKVGWVADNFVLPALLAIAKKDKSVPSKMKFEGLVSGICVGCADNYDDIEELVKACGKQYREDLWPSMKEADLHNAPERVQ
jgi:hypothetical protein